MTPPYDGQQVSGLTGPPRGLPGGRTVVTRPQVRGLRRYTDIRNWRVRSKLAAVLVIPTLAFLALAGLNLGALVLDARAYDFDTQTAAFGREVTDLVHELQVERDLTPAVLIGGDEDARTRLAAQQRQVDEAVQAYEERAEQLRGNAGPELARTLDTIGRDIAALPRLRDAVRGSSVTLPAGLDEYSNYVENLLSVTQGFSEAGRNPGLGQAVQALEALSAAKERASQVRGLLYAIALREEFQSDDREALTAALAGEEAAMEGFLTLATERQTFLVTESVRGQASLTVFRLESAARKATTGHAVDVDPEQWLAASSARIEQMRRAEFELLEQVVQRSQALTDSAERQAIINGGVIAVVLFFTLLLSLVIARSMVSQLSRLRAGALDVAQVQLPETVERLRHGDPGPQRPTDIVPVGAHSPDELGQLAAAFDAVHRQALWLATEQAVLRRDVNAMFINFSRRSQSLVERQLQLIDGLEANEQDPSALENLFRLDHLATRMRRNNESLLVIAGSESTRRWSAPVPLSDVVLAAVSEIEHFTRVTQRTEPDIALAGHAVSDVVHLLAELLENATRSSSPQNNVVVTGNWTRGGSEALIEIEDRGVGMTRKNLAEANRRLSGQPDAVVPASAHLGLYVVSRLARRHGIAVSLAEARHGGVLASVWLPANLVSTVADAGSLDAGSSEQAAPPAAAPPAVRPPAALPPAAMPTPSLPPARPGTPPPAAPPGAGPADPAQATRRPPPAAAAPGPAPSTPPAPPPPTSPPPAPPVSPAPHDLPVRRPRQPVEASADGATAHNGSTPQPSHTGEVRPTPPAPEPATLAGPPAQPPRERSAPAPTPALDDRDSNVVLSVFDSVSEWFRQQSPEPAERTDTAPAASDPVGDTSHAEPAAVRSGGDATRLAPAARAGDGTAASRIGFDAWATASDQGWAAAEEAREPVTDGVTGAGLPIRKPMAHFVPGSPERAAAAGPDSAHQTSPQRGTPQDGIPVSDADPPHPQQTSPFPTVPGAVFGRPTQPSPERVRGILSNYYRGVREGREVKITRDDQQRATPGSVQPDAPDDATPVTTDHSTSPRTAHPPDRQERT